MKVLPMHFPFSILSTGFVDTSVMVHWFLLWRRWVSRRSKLAYYSKSPQVRSRHLWCIDPSKEYKMRKGATICDVTCANSISTIYPSRRSSRCTRSILPSRSTNWARTVNKFPHPGRCKTTLPSELRPWVKSTTGCHLLVVCERSQSIYCCNTLFSLLLMLTQLFHAPTFDVCVTQAYFMLLTDLQTTFLTENFMEMNQSWLKTQQQ